MNKIIGCLILVLISSSFGALSAELTLAKEMQTDYKIVPQGRITKIDKFAIKELKTFLEAVTKAKFNISEKSTGKSIFVGTDDPKSLQDIKDQGFVIKTKNKNIYLYGKGKYGNLYAVYEFLENYIGCRWYTAYGDVKIPERSNLIIKPINSTGKYAFPVRGMQTFFYKDKKTAGLYHYRNRQNILLPESNGVENFQICFYPYVHTLSNFINPGVESHRFMHKQLEGLENKKYFISNPEFFPMDKGGKRTPVGQLCFSNQELRKELTKNILIQLEREIKKNNTAKGIITVDVNDVLYEKLCWCKKCEKLAEHYGCAGGPFWDYILDFAAKLKVLYPNIKIKNLAYQTTLMPPQHIKKIPDNLIIIFAPISSNFLEELKDVSNQRPFTVLKKWSEISDHVWFWYYPNTYLNKKEFFFIVPPSSIVGRLAEDIKTMKETGIEGTYFEYDSGGIKYRTNLSELQSWIMLKLFQNPYLEVKPLINEFTDFYYGKAAGLMRQYLYDLEDASEKLRKQNARWKYNTNDFSYLTKANLGKWNKLFDQMECLTEKNPEHNLHVKLARLGLDAATITKMAAYWHNLRNPDARLKRFEENLRDLSIRGGFKYNKAQLDKWLNEMRKLATNKITHKPLPVQFQKFPSDSVKLVYPAYPTQNDDKFFVKDPDADGGIAMFDKLHNKKYVMGFYNNVRKAYGPGGLIIREADIKANVYNLYKFNKPVTLSDKCMIFGGKKWQIHVYFDKIIAKNPDMVNCKWDIYVSLKFAGPSFSSGDRFKDDLVLCDRIILVKQRE